MNHPSSNQEQNSYHCNRSLLDFHITMLLVLFLAAAYLTFCIVQTIPDIRTKVPGPWYTALASLPLKYHEFTKACLVRN